MVQTPNMNNDFSTLLIIVYTFIFGIYCITIIQEIRETYILLSSLESYQIIKFHYISLMYL